MKKKHIGSDFDDFLREEHLLEASEATAGKRVGAGSAPPLREILIAKPPRPSAGASALKALLGDRRDGR
jgi:hypothetical protein